MRVIKIIERTYQTFSGCSKAFNTREIASLWIGAFVQNRALQL